MAEWPSLLPALVAIGFVLWKREVTVALVLAIFISEVLLALYGGETAAWLLPFSGFIASIERVAAVFTDGGNARLLLFCVLIGAPLALMSASGGVNATVRLLINSGVATNARRTGLMTFVTGVVIFIESNLSVLTAGILSRGLFDRFKMSRERLAFIIDSTSAPVCILILLNGWGAFVLGILAPYDLPATAVSILIATIPLNFYALCTLLVVFYTVWTGKVYGPLASLEQSREGATPAEPAAQTETIEAEIQAENQQKVSGRARDMLVPLSVLVLAMLFFMAWTGKGDLFAGSGSKSVLYATILSLLVLFIMLLGRPRVANGENNDNESGSHQEGNNQDGNQKYNFKNLVEVSFKGIGEILPLVAILLLSIALGASVKQLGTGIFISGLVADYLPLFLVPAMVFIAGAFAAFTTGTSWGTFALMVPIGMPIALNLDLPPSLLLAAVLGGGVFGDHCSPVSDTTAVSSMAAGCDILDHVRTQLPYAFFCGVLTIIGYVIAGLLVV